MTAGTEQDAQPSPHCICDSTEQAASYLCNLCHVTARGVRAAALKAGITTDDPVSSSSSSVASSGQDAPCAAGGVTATTSMGYAPAPPAAAPAPVTLSDHTELA
eukprot:CAMPEP_0202881792 /NCGR_PEP_ID=MMETSP1391-20130828/37071_1 /ASSEMBLY_ACC=CAM_ASM_000867 /TAXON_ID=1034604 /ORGANISM="Chlamydomonas leiostraca, Strain SAG 11-49" /LENGTH=103 /DNA_ID=CAMNT_0049564525 /DNA_START=42 /DNA_END=349 /DNA_ORIENTATION=-